MKLDCEVICDLLPSYADNLTSEKSNVIIREHLLHCQECQQVLDKMREDVETAESTDKEIDYLKTYRKNTKRSVAVSSIVWILLILCLCFELAIHLYPLYGSKKSGVNGYSGYALSEVMLSELESIEETADGATVYRYKWAEGNFLQNTAVTFTISADDTGVSIDQADVVADSLFFKQGGASVNIYGDTVYIDVTGYRKTLFVKGRAEQFCFAVRIIDE